jgi:hypothetical protein
MPYLKHRHQGSELERFCRKCGTRIEPSVAGRSSNLSAKDPDELTGNGIGAVIVGDGLMMVAVILSATNTAVSSLLWLLLLIPAFVFFGKGFADVLLARQIRRRVNQAGLDHADQLPTMIEVPASDFLKRSISGELATVPSVTERTTRNLD